MSNTDNSPEKTTPTDDDRLVGEGLGKDGTIPNTDDGIALGHSEASNFNPEEDEQAPVE